MKIVIIGAAGLVGQNLLIKLKEIDSINTGQLVAVDKHKVNVRYLKELNPDLKVIQEDVTQPGDWVNEVESADVVVMLQAQIGSLDSKDFIRNNIDSTIRVLEKMKKTAKVVHISSSVVESVATDDYTNTKREQERLVVESGFEYCILRPTLMFGWFDRKHLGWLSRFMKRIPIFPVPGNGRYMRQPLYVGDFCAIIIDCIQHAKKNMIYNITGFEQVDYIDIIREIRSKVNARCLIVKIPVFVFAFLLRVYALFDRDPPFTVDQLFALIAGDEFEVIDWPSIFSVEATPYQQAIEDTFTHPIYSKYELEF